MKTVLNWSSGKDAAMAYQLLLQSPDYYVTHLLTTINDEHDRVFMHGIRENLLEAQAQMMKLPLKKLKLPPAPDDNLYRNAMHELLTELKQENVEAAAFGDIFLEDLKTYREQQLAQIGLKGVFPLWKKDTTELVKALEAVGIEAVIVCVDARKLGKDFLGRKVDSTLLADLPAGVDPCGENGEFHTFVYNAPFFSEPIPIVQGEIVYKEYKSQENSWGFYFLDLEIGSLDSL